MVNGRACKVWGTRSREHVGQETRQTREQVGYKIRETREHVGYEARAAQEHVEDEVRESREHVEYETRRARNLADSEELCFRTFYSLLSTEYFFTESNNTKYSRVDETEFVEDCLWNDQFKNFKYHVFILCILWLEYFFTNQSRLKIHQ